MSFVKQRISLEDSIDVGKDRLFIVLLLVFTMGTLVFSGIREGSREVV
jgi:hypothetical protein